MKKNDILVLLIPSLLIVALWFIFNIYHNFVTSTIPSTLNISIQPISPDFDEKSISNIKARENVSPTYDLTGQKVVTVETTTTIPAVSSGSAQPNPASPGGSLGQ